MKKILVFSLAYFPHVGGAEVAIKEITDRLSPGEFAFDLLTLRFRPDEKDVETIGNIQVYRVKRLERLGYLGKALFPLCAALAAARLHRTHQYDAAWAMMSYMLFPLVLARFFGVRVPYLLTLQEGDPWEHTFNRWFILPVRPLLSYGFRHATAVQAISNYLGEWAKRMGYPGEVEVIPNGVDIARFTRGEGPTRTSEETVLITTSRLVKKNGIDTVIRALPLLPETVRFRVIGTGPEEKALKQLAETLGVSARVEFLGHKDQGELPRYLHNADIFIRPSRSEGMGNSFIEAMAAGLPVVGTQEGGIADFLFDETRNPDKEATGWAVDKDSPEQIAAAVKDILAHPQEAARTVAGAKRLVAKRYDWGHIAGEMRDLFARLFSGK